MHHEFTMETTLRHLDQLSSRLTWQDMDPAYVSRLVSMARDEDMAGVGLAAKRQPKEACDVTTDLMPEDVVSEARLVARKELVVCGLPVIPLVLDAYGLGCTCQALVEDGDIVAAGTVLAYLKGDARTLLRAERVLLNFLQRLSGIATHTRLYVCALGDSETRLLDTRKTTPGYRALEKYAVATGGGWNHRLGLFDRVMLKDNHLAVSGATEGDRLMQTASKAREAYPELMIQAEVDSLDQIPPLIEAGVDVILLDNFTVEELEAAVDLTKDKVRIEASGGITLNTLPLLADLGLDFISSGALVHQSVWIDIGLDWCADDA